MSVVVLGAFLYKLAAVPPMLMREQADRIADMQAKLDSYKQNEPDGTLWDAVAHITLGVWDGASFWSAPVTHIELLAGAIDALGDRAHRGAIQIWGQVSGHSRPVIIPADFWEHGRIDFRAMLNDSGAPPWTTKLAFRAPSEYVALKINRAEIEREWPHQGQR